MKTTFAPLLALALAAFSSLACSTAPDFDLDEAAADARTSSSAVVECNSIPNGAPVVTDEIGGGTMPRGKGGALLDGTYFATSSMFHPAPLHRLAARARTMIVEGSTIQYVEAGIHATASLETSGAEMTLTYTCPSVVDGSRAHFSYTATRETITLFDDEDGHVIVFTKQ